VVLRVSTLGGHDQPAPRTFNLRTIGPEPEGATPLEEEDLAGLIPEFVATRGDLNVVEFDNIAKALPWATDQARTGGPERVLDYSFVFALHRRMFEDVWRWAGTQRRRGTHIGVEPSQITMLTKQAIEDAIWWHDNAAFDADERAVRIHHRLVHVHPFPNGNGRCTRLLADLYLTAIGHPIFTWGAGGTIDEEGDVRRRYLDALLSVDADGYGPLVAFART
jgi:Fic-DOC domain mobile mystery protein B